MLILTRQEGQSLIVGKERTLEIKVLKVGATTVKFGIVGDNSIPINRKELFIEKFPEFKLETEDIV